MKPISIYVLEPTYREFKELARRQDRPVAELIREAMEMYRAHHGQPNRVLRKMPTTNRPRLKRRWSREEIHEELLA